MPFMSSADFFSKLTFSKNISGTQNVKLNGFVPAQDRPSVGSDLGPNCLQKLSADNKNRP